MLKINGVQVKLSTNALTMILTLETNRKIVVKQYGFEKNICPELPRITIHSWKELSQDYLELRHILTEANINIPHLINIGFVHDEKDLNTSLEDINDGKFYQEESLTVRFLIIEEFTGVSYKDIITSNQSNKNKTRLESRIIEVIKKLPENIELDIHPKNFTVMEDSIYFIDLMPPKIQQYQHKDIYNKIFPSINRRTEASEKRREWRYNSTEGRLQRFNYYKDKLLGV